MKRKNRKRYGDEAIIQSFLDNDVYQFTMGQFVFYRHPSINTIYSLTNRTKSVLLANRIDQGELVEQLGHYRTVRLTPTEKLYLAQQRRTTGEPLYYMEYLNFLSDHLVIPEFHISKNAGQYTMTYGEDSTWPHAIYSETPALAILAEMNFRALTQDLTDREYYKLLDEGHRRTEKKVERLVDNPTVRFMEFGTRRRAFRLWQEDVLSYMLEKIPNQVTGTSNYDLARRLGIKGKGTMAHQLFMVLAAVALINGDEALRKSHNQVLVEWEKFYGPDLLVALTDTFGSDFFFEDMTKTQANSWSGLRQDSGDPIEFGEKQLDFYTSHGIDAREKSLVPSDGLDVETLIKITNHFAGRIPVIGGWGTNLTNDFGLQTLSIVIKAISANGQGTVKLSDNMDKATGSQENIEKYKRVFRHNHDKRQLCVY